MTPLSEATLTLNPEPKPSTKNLKPCGTTLVSGLAIYKHKLTRREKLHHLAVQSELGGASSTFVGLLGVDFTTSEVLWRLLEYRVRHRALLPTFKLFFQARTNTRGIAPHRI
jgi:hypothetical protein